MAFFYVFKHVDTRQGLVVSSNRRIPEDINIQEFDLEFDDTLQWRCVGQFKADSNCDYTHNALGIAKKEFKHIAKVWNKVLNIMIRGV